MASRGTFGFRSAKQSEKEDKRTKTPTGLSRAPSITANTPNPSKLPTHSTSFFSRNKPSKAKGEPQVRAPATPNAPSSSGQQSVSTGVPRSETMRSEAESNVPLGGPGMSSKTTVQAKSGKPRNVLRRRAGSIEQKVGSARTESSASSYEPTPSRLLESRSSPGGYTDNEPRSIFGVTAPSTSSSSAAAGPRLLGLGSEFATSSSHMANYNSRKQTQSPATSTLPPPTPNYAHDSGSSTRRSESPGGFSRTSTPTSMSSQSPGVPTPAKPTTRARGNSPGRSRPPVTWGRFHKQLMHQAENGASRGTGLTAVRESATSSSSSSTVKPESRTGTSRAAYNEPVSPRTATPPSRTSSKRDAPSQSQGFPQRKGSLTYRSERARNLGTSTAVAADADIERAQTAPPRPSREGVPRLDVSLVSPTDHTPRLQPSAPISDSKARPSIEKDRFGPRQTRGDSLSTTSSAQPSRMPSPNLQNLASRSRPSPSVETQIGGKATKDPSPQSASSTKSSSRFGFFTRRTKSPMEAASNDKASKKGPAAGTGHEGYGKYALRGRSGSSATSASRGRSTSSTSIGRTPSSRKSSLTSREENDLDDFYRERLAPKHIVGGGKGVPDSGADLYMSSSAQSSNNTLESSISTSRAFQSRVRQVDVVAAAQEPAHRLHHVNRRLPQREGEGKASSNDLPQTVLTPTLAARRSLHRSQHFEGAEPVRIPAPIKTEGRTESPLGSRDAPLSSRFNTDTTMTMAGDISEGHEGNWLNPKKNSKPKKSPRNWNFFQRSRGSPKKREPVSAPRSDDDEAAFRDFSTTNLGTTEYRQMPYYALIDNGEPEPFDQLSSGQQTRRSSQVKFGSFSTNRSRSSSPIKQQHKQSMLLPSPPTLPTEFPQQPPSIQPLSEQAPPEPIAPVETVAHDEPSEPRRPRLQQIGRIPRVVSKRDRVHRPAPQSFSRPRPVTPRQEAASSSGSLTGQGQPLPELEQPPLAIRTEGIPQKPWHSQDSGKPASAPVRLDEPSAQSGSKDEFLVFPPRIGSEVSGSSSSGILSYAAATTAVRPVPGMAPDDDEVWNEYNDFLDTVQSSASLSERPNPLDTSKAPTRFQPAPLHVRKDSSVTGSRSGSPVKLHAATYPPVSAAPNRDLPSPPKKSKLLEPPNTPGTISDLLANYERGSFVFRHLSQSTTSRYSTSSIESEADSLAGQEAQGLHMRSATTHLTPARRLSQIYLRRDALLASRWLSFDRVLFSPAHFELQTNAKDRILVLDGLGNDEWSYFCAENYPTAMVYNLSPIDRSNDPPPLQLPGVPKPPENHKHILQTSFDKQFPFPQGFFTAAVFRFPVASSEAVYYNAISEFKRVLRPGGYLEMSLVDIDMVNMGNLTRKALRLLKERKHGQDNDVSLKALSDNIQKMLGKKAFENLNRCTLDVPVAGQVNNSRADSFDSASGKVPQPAGERASGSIARSLSKVGRWWYSSCYESGLQNSIWNDKALLAECEARETGFKLLLCYAQKPMFKRRTRSF